ncbi:hypothetical protein BpHYR1_028210 [Brachionus plicatilis]|uniref:Uncharacterized protein n=1 Tax=Brachionus plicatilis TaxID=10195 RepID=A0A3M7P844_BRAPC|nr:hypothetical protein BpHYR1_028210 [Brachionus plicatilis]
MLRECKIPEIDFYKNSGSLGGKFTTLEVTVILDAQVNLYALDEDPGLYDIKTEDTGLVPFVDNCPWTTIYVCLVDNFF